jgi:molybdate transport system substrate-binding protein
MSLRLLRVTLTIFGSGAVLLAAGVSQAAEIKVLAANAVREPFLQIAAAFENATGHKVIAMWSGTAGIVKRVDDDELVDLVIAGSDAIDKLASDGKLSADSRADFAKTGVGIAVRAGAPKPDVSSEEAVKKAVLDAGSVAYSSGPSGTYVAQLFDRMGVTQLVKAKLIMPPPNVQVGDLLARGQVELGFQQVSDLLPVQGIDFLGPLPPSLQSYTIYRMALHRSAPQPGVASAFVRFLLSPAARPVITKAGMEPG